MVLHALDCDAIVRPLLKEPLKQIPAIFRNILRERQFRLLDSTIQKLLVVRIVGRFANE